MCLTKGFPQAMTSFKANDVQMIALLVGNPDLARQIREGEVKGTVAGRARRDPILCRMFRHLPNPFDGDETKFTPMVRFFAPKGTPKEYVEAMSAEINAIMANAEFRERFLTSKGLASAGSKPEILRNSWCPTARRGRSCRHLRRQARRITRMALNYEKIMAYRPADIRATYGPRDCMLYALGIGLGMDPLDHGQLRFVYEKNLARSRRSPPTLGWMGRLTDPEFGIDERMVVLADQRVVLHRPLAPEATLISRPASRKSSTRARATPRSSNSRATLRRRTARSLRTVEGSTLARKHGGFGGKVTQSPVPPEIPVRDPMRCATCPRRRTWRKSSG